MYLGFLTVCLGKLPLKEKAKWASENGFKALEVACWPQTSNRDYCSCDIDVNTLTQSTADEITGYFKEYNLTISSLAFYENNLHCDLQQRAAHNSHLMKCIDAAVMLRVPAVGTFIGRNIQKSIKDNFDEFEKVFSEIVAYAERNHIRLLIENCPMEGWQVPGLPGTISFTPELWEEMFKRIPSPYFGLNYDPSHLVWQLIDYKGMIPKFKDRIFHFHAKDTELFEEKMVYYGSYNRQLDSGGFWRYRIPGMGMIDWDELFGALKESGYNGVISIEHEDPIYEGSEERVKEGLILARKYLEKSMK